MYEPKQRKVTQRRGESSADCARRMGWKVGTKLIGDEGYGAATIVITALGERVLLAKRIDKTGHLENTWTLSCRDWHEVAA